MRVAEIRVKKQAGLAIVFLCALVIAALLTRRQSAPMQSRAFSFHKCVGGGSGDTHFYDPKLKDAHDVTSCEFFNLCFDDGEFVYFSSADTSERTSFGVERNNAGKTFGGPVDLVPQPLLVVAGREAAERQSKMPLRQVFGDIPLSAKWETGTSMVLKRFGAANFGHAVVEVALPAFALMSYFQSGNEFLENDIQFLFLDDCFDQNDHFVAYPDDDKYRQACKRHTNNLFGLLSKLSAKVLPKKRGMMCFPRILAGIRPFSFLYGPVPNDGGKGIFLHLWRDFVFKKNDIAPLKDAVCRIVISRKDSLSYNSRDINNPTEVAEFLQEKFKFSHVLVEVVNFAKLSLLQQILKISVTDIWITPGGATSFIAPFLPDAATLILVPFCTKTACPFNPMACVCNDDVCCYIHEHYFHNFIRANVAIFRVKIPRDIVGKCDCEGFYRCKDCHVQMDLDEVFHSVQRALFYSKAKKYAGRRARLSRGDEAHSISQELVTPFRAAKHQRNKS
jgi:hypothetical protein